MCQTGHQTNTSDHWCDSTSESDAEWAIFFVQTVSRLCFPFESIHWMRYCWANVDRWLFYTISCILCLCSHNLFIIKINDMIKRDNWSNKQYYKIYFYFLLIFYYLYWLVKENTFSRSSSGNTLISDSLEIVSFILNSWKLVNKQKF